MNWLQIKALFFNSFTREIRNKTLIFVFVLTIFILLIVNFGMNYMANTFLNEQLFTSLTQTKMYAFYIVIVFWNNILAALLGVSSVKADIDNQIMFHLWSFPIKKIEYLVSRILGTWAIVLFYYIVSLVFAYIIFALTNKDFTFETGVLKSFLVSSLSMLAVVTFAVFYSLFLPKIIAFVTVFFTSFMVSSANQYFAYSDSASFKDMNVLKLVAMILNFIFPRVGNINSWANSYLSSGTELKLSIPFEIAHFLFTYTILLFATWFILINKNVQDRD
ncbi:MAG: hypothetical protein U0T83_04680 [Bacteriovoracaceae bacterium]